MKPRIEDIGSFNAVRESGLAKLMCFHSADHCGNGYMWAWQRSRRGISRAERGHRPQRTGCSACRRGCFGACFQEPLVGVRIPGAPLVILHHVRPNDAGRILEAISSKVMPPDLIFCKLEDWDHITAQFKFGQGYPEIPLWNLIPFFKGQKKIVLRNSGLINPEDIEEYIAVGGYQSLYKVLIDGRPESVIEQIKASRLRGRGGAGFLTGNKWDFLAKAKADEKYIICNADEGDPGAYMNRNEIESDPHSVLEGMIIGAYATGSTKGIVYIRAEYPLAVRRLSRAIEQAREYGLLGKEYSQSRIRLQYRVGSGCGRICLRRRDGADCVIGRKCRSPASASTVPGAARTMGNAH